MTEEINVVEIHNHNNSSGIKCPKCGSNNVNIQAVSDVKSKHRGCLGWLFWILLACCTLGLILIIPALTNSKTKTKIRKKAVCQNCGNMFNI